MFFSFQCEGHLQSIFWWPRIYIWALFYHFSLYMLHFLLSYFSVSAEDKQFLFFIFLYFLSFLFNTPSSNVDNCSRNKRDQILKRISTEYEDSWYGINTIIQLNAMESAPANYDLRYRPGAYRRIRCSERIAPSGNESKTTHNKVCQTCVSLFFVFCFEQETSQAIAHGDCHSSDQPPP